MQITIEIPDEIASHMEAKWGNLHKRTLKIVAAEAYRVEAITCAEVRRLLELSSRWEAHGFLKREGAYLHYTEADLEQDRLTLSKLRAE